MESTNIVDYKEQLESLCVACRKFNKCKDRTTICAFKKFAFALAKRKYKRELRKV